MSIEEIFSYRKESLIPQIDETTSDGESSKSKLLRLLDEIENRVERFRRGALLMEEEKDILFSSIDAIKSSDLISDLLESMYHLFLAHKFRIIIVIKMMQHFRRKR